MRLQQAFQDLRCAWPKPISTFYAQDALTATEAEKAAVAGQLESAKRNFELGNATITDTYEAQARYDLVLAQELRLQNDLDVRRDVLAQILGSPAGALAELPPGVRLAPAGPAERLEHAGRGLQPGRAAPSSRPELPAATSRSPRAATTPP